MSGSKQFRIGVLSDTHNRLDPALPDLFTGVDCMLHAGDITSKRVLETLGHSAPVYAVRGNMDQGLWAVSLPDTRLLEFNGVGIYMLHDLARMDIKPQAAGIQVVVYGHTHRASVQRHGGVLYLNPGSAGASRSGPPSVALLDIENGKVDVRIQELHVR